MNWDVQLKEILAAKGYSNCPSCGREIDRGDFAWNNGATGAGTPMSHIEIQCLACDTEVAYVESWYPEIEDLEDLCWVLKQYLPRRQD